MGRGPHQITKDKRELKQLTKVAIAIKRAEKKLDAKDFWNDLPLKLRESFLKMLEKVDPLEVIAIGGLTVLIKPILPKLVLAQELSSQVIIDWWKIWAFPLFGMPTAGQPGQPTLEELLAKHESGEMDLFYWTLSFVVAFIIIRYGDKILELGSNVANIITLMGFALI